MIAKAAVKQAGEEGTDVVLIDTAGRMQVRRCPGYAFVAPGIACVRTT